jgi:hypothetical protein
MATCVIEHMATCVLEHMATCVLEHIATCVLEHMTTCVLEHMVTCALECMVTCVFEHVATGVWKFASTIYYFDRLCQQHFILTMDVNNILIWQLCQQRIIWTVGANTMLFSVGVNIMKFCQFATTALTVGVNSIFILIICINSISLTYCVYCIILWQFASSAYYFDSLCQ